MRLIVLGITTLLSWSSIAMDTVDIEKTATVTDDKEHRSFIACSTRRLTNPMSSLREAYHGVATCEFRHLQSFGGNAITIDTDPCAIDAQHIVGSVLTYDFSNYVIDNFLFERPPTKENFLPKAIDNISPHMAHNAKLIIELDPYYVLGTVAGSWPVARADLLRDDPFHGWHNYVVALQSLLAAADDNFDAETLRAIWKNKPNVDDISEEIIADAIALRNMLIDISATTGISLEDLNHRVRREMGMYNELWMCSARNTAGEWWLSLPNLRPELPIANYNKEDLEELFQNRRLTHLTGCDVNKFEAIQKTFVPVGERLVTCQYFNMAEMFQGALSNFILSSNAVAKNAGAIKEFLTKRGFVDVVVEFGTNELNGRKNVWMVRARKN